MSKYANLIALLENIDDKATSELSILSDNLRLDDAQNTLNEYSINFEDQSEGVFIDLASQPIRIFKSEESAVEYLNQGDFDKDIIVLQKHNGTQLSQNREIEFLHEQPNNKHPLFENILFYFKLKSLLVDENICSYYDETFFNLIFLSSKQGRLDVKCKIEWYPEFYKSKNDLENLYQLLENTISGNHDFVDFFRESYVEVAKQVSNKEIRYVKTLQQLKHIIESAERNYELFKHNFSFKEFKSEFDLDKEKYLKDYQANLSDLLSKIAAMPVQFGVYIYLITRFGEELVPLVAVTFLIGSWSFFKAKTISRIQENIEYLKDKFLNDFEKLLIQSGIKETEVLNDKKQILEKFNKTESLIKYYKLFILIFTAFCLITSLYLISKLNTCF